MVQKFGLSRDRRFSGRSGQPIEPAGHCLHQSQHWMPSGPPHGRSVFLGATLFDLLTASAIYGSDLITRSARPCRRLSPNAVRPTGSRDRCRSMDEVIAACLARPRGAPESAAEAGSRFAAGKIGAAAVSPWPRSKPPRRAAPRGRSRHGRRGRSQQHAPLPSRREIRGAEPKPAPPAQTGRASRAGCRRQATEAPWLPVPGRRLSLPSDSSFEDAVPKANPKANQGEGSRKASLPQRSEKSGPTTPPVPLAPSWDEAIPRTEKQELRGLMIALRPRAHIIVCYWSPGIAAAQRREPGDSVLPPRQFRKSSGFLRYVGIARASRAASPRVNVHQR